MEIDKAVRYAEACDISYWQGKLDAEKMKAAGVRACIVRAGYGTTVDKRFVSYINDLIRAGMHVGVYWFIYAASIAKTKENAEKCIEVLKPYKGMIECGVWADWEYDSDARAGYMTVDKRCAIVRAFLSEMENAGYSVGIYSNQDYIKSGKFSRDLIAAYPLWFAKYSADAGQYAHEGKYNTPYLWQYTSSGKGRDYGVESATIDLDRCYIDLSPESASTGNVVDAVQTDKNNVSVKDNPYPVPTRTLYYETGRYQMNGDDIKWAQWHLWRFGLFLDKHGLPDAKQIDGYFGAESAEATREAQRRLGLAVDGRIGPATREKFLEVA